MGVRRVEDLIAWQLALEFRDAVYDLVRSHQRADRDLRFRDQLFAAVASTTANITEGFHRNRTREFMLFLSYARGSHAEAETRLRDGIARGYFPESACEKALLLAKRCGQAILKLILSLKPFAAK